MNTSKYFQELMAGILKDFIFAITYLDDNNLQQDSRGIFGPLQASFKKIQNAQLSMKLCKCHFFAKEIQHLGHMLCTMGIRPLPSKSQAINNMHPPKTAKQVCTFLGLVGYYKKFTKEFAMIAKQLTLLTCHKAKFEWTPVHHTAFMMLKEAIIQAPILCYPDPTKRYMVCMDALDDACGPQLLQEHNGTKFPIAFLSHTFSEMQRKWRTPEQEAYRVYYAIPNGTTTFKELTS